MIKKNRSSTQTWTVEEEQHPALPFWSGVITFGAINLPVSLFAENRKQPPPSSIVNMKRDQRRQRCFYEKAKSLPERESIVRDHSAGETQLVIIEGKELKALTPEKTAGMDLRRFASLDELNPVFFERGYFLAPDFDAIKGYRLLAKSMAEERRAGIATLVMQQREYVIAIVAEEGILRADTLRFNVVDVRQRLNKPSESDDSTGAHTLTSDALEKLKSSFP